MTAPRHSTRLRATAAAACCAALFAAAAGPAAAATRIVPTEYPTIQNAIDAAAANDTVMVEPGTYRENIVLRSLITVRGREAARTFLEPNTSTLPTVRVNLGDNARFANFTLIGADVGIEVNVSANIEIANVVFLGASDRAIEIDTTSTVAVRNSVFFNNDTAIRRNTPNVDIVNNVFAGNETTVTSLNPLLDDDVNVDRNCWFNNGDGSHGTGVVTGDPLFVDTARSDFHLRVGSPCINAGAGTDAIDGTAADIGAYGGPLADTRPYPIVAPTLTDTSDAAAGTFNVLAQWPANLGYMVTRYAVHYGQSPPGNPYSGLDAGGGTQPSPIDAGNVTSFTLANLAPSPPSLGATLLLTAQGAHQSVTLSWQPVANATGYSVHYGAASTNEQEVAAGNVTTFTVGGLANGTTYVFAVRAEARAAYRVAITARDSTTNQHESAIVAETSIPLGTPNLGPLSNELPALPQFVAAYPLLPDEGGGCFIATAAYGADWEAEVQILRDFRDRYLLSHGPGRWLVARYYEFSPPLAAWLQQHDSWRAAVRVLLAPFVGVALLLVGSGALTKAALALALALAIAVRRRRGAIS